MGQDSQRVPLPPVGAGTRRQVLWSRTGQQGVASAATLVSGVLAVAARGTAPALDPDAVRAAARAAGLDSLAKVVVPMPDLRVAEVLNSDDPDAGQTLLQLSKACSGTSR